MTSHVTTDWASSNQQYLSAAIAAVRASLDRHAGHRRSTEQSDATSGSVDATIERRDSIAEAMPRPPALEWMRIRFGLSPFERDVLALCAGMELEATCASTCASAHGDDQRPYPTFGLALAALPASHWSALRPDAPLRHWHLIELGAGGLSSAPITTRPLRIDERVLHCLTDRKSVV